MIIRHDLELVFVHVPKCAGKQLRWIFKQGAKRNEIEELWNYGHSKILNRYVDLAHLPLSDLRTYPQFKYLNRYKVVACIRDPYMRLPSAANEFYRQKSKQDEKMVINGKLTINERMKYYKRLKEKHNELDPRFIHSLPIHRFTHYGDKAKVDYLLRCETLGRDIRSLATEKGWPLAIQKGIESKFKAFENTKGKFALTNEEIEIAEEIYKVDFETFDYPRRRKTITSQEIELCDAGQINHIHDCNAVVWHWGPVAERSKQQLKQHR